VLRDKNWWRFFDFLDEAAGRHSSPSPGSADEEAVVRISACDLAFLVGQVFVTLLGFFAAAGPGSRSAMGSLEPFDGSAAEFRAAYEAALAEYAATLEDEVTAAAMPAPQAATSRSPGRR
jgi:hypothetical protein